MKGWGDKEGGCQEFNCRFFFRKAAHYITGSNLHMKLKRFAVLLAFLAGPLAASAQMNTAQFHLRNAWETAKWLYAEEKRTVELDSAQGYQLWESLLWYANVADLDEGDTYSALVARLRHYPALFDLAFPHFSIPQDFFRYADSATLAKCAANNEALKTAINYQKQLVQARTSRVDALIADRALDTVTQTIDAASRRAETSRVKLANMSPDDSAALLAEGARLKTALKDSTDARAELDKKRLAVNERIQLAEDTGRIIQKKIDYLFEKEATRLTRAYCELNKEECSKAGKLIKENSIQRSIDPRQIPLDNVARDVQNTQRLVIQAEISSAGGGGYHLPSQSEMIDAFAIYLAGRIKQEAVMWFFEALANDARQYEQIRTFFPATMTLLRSNEVFEIPNMGAQWQYALSKDFLSLPRNVLTSTWLQQRWYFAKGYKSYISGFCDMSDLLVKRESYREIVRTLYLADNSEDDAADGKLEFRDFINLLYAVNTELFLPDSAQNYRLLKYEDYSGMNQEELEIMLSLIDMKYHGMLGKMLKLKTSNDNVFELHPTITAEKLRRLLGCIEVAVNRIELVRNDFLALQKKMEGSSDKDWAYTPYSLWGSVNELLDVFSARGANGSVFSTGWNMTRSQTAFAYTGQMFEIYNLITRKNFSGAVQNTIALVDTILYAGGRDSLTRIKLTSVTTLK